MADQRVRSRHIAVLGSSGLVGGALVQECKQRKLRVTGTHYQHPAKGSRALDLTDPSAVGQFLDTVSPSVVICTAAETHVDRAETEEAMAAGLNVVAVGQLGQACASRDINLVFLSSDYVFDGTSGPYEEDDQPNPINVYGRQKLQAEQQLLATSRSTLVLRTTVVFGWERQGKNFVVRLLESLADGKTVDVPADQVGTPTYAPDLARATIELVLQGATGIVNVAGPTMMSRSEFAKTAAKVFGFNPGQINPILTRGLQQVADRPLQAGLVTIRLRKMVGDLMRDPLDALGNMAESEKYIG